MNMATAQTARKRCSRSGWKRYRGRSTASPARKRSNRDCCNAGRRLVAADHGGECRRARKASTSVRFKWSPAGFDLAKGAQNAVPPLLVEYYFIYRRARLGLHDGSRLARVAVWRVGGG